MCPKTYDTGHSPLDAFPTRLKTLTVELYVYGGVVCLRSTNQNDIHTSLVFEEDYSDPHPTALNTSIRALWGSSGQGMVAEVDQVGLPRCSLKGLWNHLRKLRGTYVVTTGRRVAYTRL